VDPLTTIRSATDSDAGVGGYRTGCTGHGGFLEHPEMNISLDELLPVLGWGLVAAVALPLGAVVGCFAKLPQRVVAGIMAFGAGALITALSIELMLDAYEKAGLGIASVAFGGGALLFTLADIAINKWEKSHKTSTSQKNANKGSRGLSIAAGSLLDNIPEMLVLGMGMSSGQPNLVILVAIFVSNFPEGLGSGAQLKQAGKPSGFIVGLWICIGLLAALSAVIGNLVFSGSTSGMAIANAVAAGAMLAMIVDTMIPEAYQESHEYSGLITAFGFLVAFLLHTFQK
jgi:ZIP family zinc transporter